MAQYNSLFSAQLDTFENHGSRDGIGLDIDWQRSDEFPSNELDLITDAILQIERSLGGGIGVGPGLWDTDRDTGVQVEEAADEDIIRFDTAGTERMTIDGDTINITEYLRHLGDVNTYLRFTPDRIRFLVGNLDFLDMTAAATNSAVFNGAGADIDFRIETTVSANLFTILGNEGKIYINDTANAEMTIGLTVNQADNDNEILTFKSSDVGHSCTGLTEADTYFSVKKYQGAAGGAYLTGLKDPDGLPYGAFIIHGILEENVDTTHNAGGWGLVRILASEVAANNPAAVVANGNLLTVENNTSTKFIVDAEGDLFADGGTGSTTMVIQYDDFEDAHLIRAFDIARSRNQLVRSQFDKFLKYNEDDLVELGILGDRIQNGGLINVTRLQQLHNGAIWQNYTAIKDHDRKLAICERAFERISQALGIPVQSLLAIGN